MSRVSTPPTAQPIKQPVPATAQGAASVKIPHERIAMRAYEKWVQRGRPQGTDLKDWIEAEAELLKEAARGGTTATPTARPQR
jgi:Protein of unknown function (DUF2934)